MIWRRFTEVSSYLCIHKKGSHLGVLRYVLIQCILYVFFLALRLMKTMTKKRMELFKKNKIIKCSITLQDLKTSVVIGQNSEKDLGRPLIVNISDPADPPQEIHDETAEEALDLTFLKFRPWE